MSAGARLAGWIWDRSRFVAGAVAVVTALAAWEATRVGVDNSLAVWFVEDDPQLLGIEHHRHDSPAQAPAIRSRVAEETSQRGGRDHGCAVDW